MSENTNNIDTSIILDTTVLALDSGELLWSPNRGHQEKWEGDVLFAGLMVALNQMFSSIYDDNVYTIQSKNQSSIIVMYSNPDNNWFLIARSKYTEKSAIYDLLEELGDTLTIGLGNILTHDSANLDMIDYVVDNVISSFSG
ncbi:MAG: hypothetical protein KGD59_14540 [Candidatus Heimdallarchaeota archaeon]|nr:hypothetical protein [Candidatus Heimdallarchaeota archaeon]MBY8995766.1 hypothetical protein [Candidatus Heimdallarchaeota archaeon]